MAQARRAGEQSPVLPPPMTADQMYLAAILDELRAQRKPTPKKASGATQLREPKAKR